MFSGETDGPQRATDDFSYNSVTLCPYLARSDKNGQLFADFATCDGQAWSAPSLNSYPLTPITNSLVPDVEFPGCKKMETKMATSVRHRDRGHFECAICADMATKYNFGVVSCNACRQFFKRIISKEKQSKLPPCRQYGMCPIGADNRKDCIRCRYRKCLQVGMRPDLVTRAAEVYARKHGDQERSKMAPIRNVPFPAVSMDYRLPDNELELYQ
ncbi:Nuclear hormone receptor family member nhr-1 [Halotydeus destructor]|nr:Nuclear hormone receptor family member nhr-1 [Halotydeus destructor]